MHFVFQVWDSMPLSAFQSEGIENHLCQDEIEVRMSSLPRVLHESVSEVSVGTADIFDAEIVASYATQIVQTYSFPRNILLYVFCFKFFCHLPALPPIFPRKFSPDS